VTFWRSLPASDRAAAKLMAASANSGRPALSSIPGTATIAAAAVVARPNLNSALIGKRIDGPLDTLALGPICHKGFALPLSLCRHFEEKLNQSFKKLVINGTATVFGSGRTKRACPRQRPWREGPPKGKRGETAAARTQRRDTASTGSRRAPSGATEQECTVHGPSCPRA
jgi:hypothetical protein